MVEMLILIVDRELLVHTTVIFFCPLRLYFTTHGFSKVSGSICLVVLPGAQCVIVCHWLGTSRLQSVREVCLKLLPLEGIYVFRRLL